MTSLCHVSLHSKTECRWLFKIGTPGVCLLERDDAVGALRTTLLPSPSYRREQCADAHGAQVWLVPAQGWPDADNPAI